MISNSHRYRFRSGFAGATRQLLAEQTTIRECNAGCIEGTVNYHLIHTRHCGKLRWIYHLGGKNLLEQAPARVHADAHTGRLIRPCESPRAWAPSSLLPPLFSSLTLLSNLVPSKPTDPRGSRSRVMDVREFKTAEGGTLTMDELITALGAERFTTDRDQLEKHAHSIAENPHTMQMYIDLILATRKKLSDEAQDHKLVTAASNAISILNYGALAELIPFRFDEVRDWSGIRVPHANLGRAKLFNCNLDRSDLSHCILLNAVLRDSTFCGADLTNVVTQTLACLRGHNGPVLSVAVSPTGKLIASGSSDRTILLWDFETGQCLSKLKGHRKDVCVVRFSPDGALLASGSRDGTIRLWETDSKQCVRTLQAVGRGDMGAGRYAYPDDAKESSVTSVDFSPDGKLFASVCNTNEIWIWDVESQKCIKKIVDNPDKRSSDHYLRLSRISFSPDGRLLASASTCGSVDLWNVQSGAWIMHVDDHAHDCGVCSVGWSADGNSIVLADESEGIRIASAQSGKRESSFAFYREVFEACFNPNGKTIAFASIDHNVQSWWIEDGRWSDEFDGHRGKVWCVRFSSCGNFLVSGSEDRTVRIWQAPVTRPFSSCLPELPNGVEQSPHVVSFSPDGAVFASSTDPPVAIRLWSITSGHCIGVLRGHTKPVDALCFNVDGSSLASGSRDKTIRLWNVSTGECMAILSGHEREVGSVCFSRDGKLLASAGKDATIRVWDVESKTELTKIITGYTSVSRIAFSPDGKHLTCEMRGVFVRRWNIESRDCIAMYEEADPLTSYLLVSPAGTLIASCSANTIKLRDAASGETILTLESHDEPMTRVNFSWDGQLLFSRHQDDSLRIWDAASGDCLKTVYEPAIMKSRMYLYADHRVMATTDDMYSYKFWNLETMPHPRLQAIVGVPRRLDLAHATLDEANVHPLLPRLAHDMETGGKVVTTVSSEPESSEEEGTDEETTDED